MVCLRGNISCLLFFILQVIFVAMQDVKIRAMSNKKRLNKPNVFIYNLCPPVGNPVRCVAAGLFHGQSTTVHLLHLVHFTVRPCFSFGQLRHTKVPYYRNFPNQTESTTACKEVNVKTGDVI